jgi:hypothetical protein
MVSKVIGFSWLRIQEVGICKDRDSPMQKPEAATIYILAIEDI